MRLFVLPNQFTYRSRIVMTIKPRDGASCPYGIHYCTWAVIMDIDANITSGNFNINLRKTLDMKLGAQGLVPLQGL